MQTKQPLQTVLENICAEIKTKSNDHIDFRTTVGRATNEFIKRVANTDVYVDPAQKINKKAEEAKPAEEVPDETITEEVVRRVVDGEVVKSTDRDTQKRKANKNSSLSSEERKRIALKAAKTRNKDKAGLRDADKARAKAAAKRELLNL